MIQNEGTENEIIHEVSCTVNVESADVILEGMGISHKLVNLKVGDNLQISTSLRPVNANVTSDGKALEAMVWTVEDETIATVDTNGMVIAKKGGTTNVTATGNGFSVSCLVNVANDNIVQESVEAKVAGYTLSLEGTIGVNFHMQLGAEVIADNGAYMNFTLDGKEYLQIPVAKATTDEKDGTTCYVFKCGVPVKDMETKITGQIILSEGRKGFEYSYTVKEYIDYIFENQEEYTEELALVEAMSNFGKKATSYFAEESVGEIPSVTSEELSTLDDYQAVIFGNENRIYYGSSLLLKSDTILRHYFREKVTVVETGYTVKEKGNLWYVELEGIPAHELGIPKIITVTTTAGDTITIEYSPLSYAYIALSREGVAKNLTSLMRVMYLYHQAAQDYLVEKINN